MPSDHKIAKLLGTHTVSHTSRVQAFDHRFQNNPPPQLPILSVFRPDDERNLSESILATSRDDSHGSLRRLTDRFPLPQSAASAERTSSHGGPATLSPSAFTNTFKATRQIPETRNDNGGARNDREDSLSVRVRRKRDIGRLDGRERSHSNAAPPMRSRFIDDGNAAASPEFSRHGSEMFLDHFRRPHVTTFDTETSSLAYGSEHSSRSTNSHRTTESSSMDPYATVASYGRQGHTKQSHAQPIRRRASELTAVLDLPAFPSNRSILMLGMITQDFDVKIDTGGQRRLLPRRKDWQTRCVMLSSNARQAQGQLSSKLATLTGADTIGESNFFFDTCMAEQAFACLHLFKTHVDDTCEDDRLHITSNSYVAVAETTNNDQAQWGLRIAGLPGSLSTTNKSRAAEATQVEWTLRFDSKFRMLDWQTTLRALIIALTDAESEFRTGLKSKRSVASLGGASSCNSPLSSQWSPTFPQQRFGNLTQRMYDGSSDSETSEDIDEVSPAKAVNDESASPSAKVKEPAFLDSISKTQEMSTPEAIASKLPEPSPQSYTAEFGVKEVILRSRTGSSRLRYSLRGSDGICPPPRPPPLDAIPPAPLEAISSQTSTEQSAIDDELGDQLHALALNERYASSARSSMTSATDRSSMSKRRGSIQGKIDGKAMPDVPESVAANTDFRWSSVLTKHSGMGDVTVTSFLDSASSADSAYDEDGLRKDVKTKSVTRSASLARQAFECLTFDSKSEHVRVDSPIEPMEYAGRRTTVCTIIDDHRSSIVSYTDDNDDVTNQSQPPQHLQAAISSLHANCHSKEEAEALLQAARQLARRYRARNETATTRATTGV